MSSFAEQQKLQQQDSAKEVKQFFNRYFSKQVNLTSNEVDSVVGFFTKRKFSKDSAIAVATVLLNQAKVENKNIFELVDSLEGLDEVSLSKLVAAILNNNRSKVSALGYKNNFSVETNDNRNVRI